MVRRQEDIFFRGFRVFQYFSLKPEDGTLVGSEKVVWHGPGETLVLADF